MGDGQPRGTRDAGMAKKKLGNVNIFTGEGMGAVDTSFETFDAQLYGEIAKVDEGRQVAKPISIFDIIPDGKSVV